MTYLKRSNRVSSLSNKGGKAFTVFVVLLMMFAVNYFFPAFYPTVLYPVASVFWKVESSIVGWFSYMGQIVQSKYSLVKENEKLAVEIASQDRAMLIIDSLKNENDSLKAILGRVKKNVTVLGVVLSRPPVSAYDTLIIDIGSSDGVKTGDRVYAYGDVLIGDIAEVYSGQSKVSLFSMPGRETPVLVGTSTVAVVARGRGGGNFVFKLPVKVSLVKGATIILPQIRPHTFGIIEHITVDPTDSLQTILFRSPANMSQLYFVEVEKINKK